MAGISVICFGLIVLGCLVFPVAAADKLYSIDPVLDKLVIIDSGSLAISEIGPLGVDITGIPTGWFLSVEMTC